MTQYIDKDVLTEKLRERRIKHRDFGGSPHSEYGHEDDEILSLINSLEVKEVDLKKEIDDAFLEDKCNITDNVSLGEFERIAKYFFELGLSVNNPITAADRGVAEEIIINLKRIESDYRIDLTKEMEWVRNKVKK